MSLSLPRLDVDPYDDPELFVETWDVTMDAIEGAFDESANAFPYNAEIDGVGRLVGSDYQTTDAGAPQLPDSPALAVLLPNDTVIYVENTRFVVDSAGSGLNLTDVPDDFSGYGYASLVDLGESEMSLEVTTGHWSATLRPDWTKAGFYCIGKVTTSGGFVTAIDKDYEDRILPNPVMRALAVAGGGEGEGTGVSQAAFDALELIVMGLLTRVGALETATGTGTTSTSNDSPLAFTRHSMVLASQANDRVDDFPAYPGSLLVREVTGSGEVTSVNTLPDVRAGGEWDQ